MSKNDFEKHSSTEESLMNSEEKKKYAKLTPEIKQMFIEKIVFENLSIKQASELLRINYSSAKAIASSHKRLKLGHARKGLNKKTAKMCAFRPLDTDQGEVSVSGVCSSVGGLLVSEQALPKRKPISKVFRPIPCHPAPHPSPELALDC